MPVWSKYSNLPSHGRSRLYHRLCFGLPSAPLSRILTAHRDGKGYKGGAMDWQHLFLGRSSATLRNDQKVSDRDTQDLRAAPRHETPCRPRRDGTWADRQDTTIPPTRPGLNPNPPAPRPAAPPPRLWSAPPVPPGPAYAAAPSVSPWPAAAATALPPPPAAPPPDVAHSLRPAPAHTAAAACPPGA